MPYNELRKDYLLNRWVVIATERARRPTDFAKEKTDSANSSICPLCKGNEHVTPPAVLVYLPTDTGFRKDIEQGDLRSHNWLIRTIPNLYPAFAPPRNSKDGENIAKDGSFGYAIGHHEVVVESPSHNDQPSDASQSQLIHVSNAYIDRLNELSSKPYVKYIQIFRNYGLDAGASLSHPHSQIIATPFVPSIVNEEMLACKDHFEKHRTCFFCDLIKKERQTQRHVLENDYFEVITPYASINPMEFWIIPKHHASNFASQSQEEITSFTQILQTTLKALKNLVNDPPYNYGIHLSIDKETQDYYHWHLEVYPHLAIWAGFEKSTGMYINTMPPETAAQELKKTIEMAK